MIHYSCDRCKCELDPELDLRYVVHIEIEAAIEELPCDSEDDPDHLEEVAELLESHDEYCSATFSEEPYQRKRFDLCTRCYRQFIKNPLGKEASNNLFGLNQN